MSQNISDFNLYKKNKEYNKENFYTPVFNAFMRNELTMQEKAFFIYICGFGEKCFQSQFNICNDLNITGPTLRKLMKSLEENTGLLSQHSQQIIRYLQNTYPSDY